MEVISWVIRHLGQIIQFFGIIGSVIAGLFTVYKYTNKPIRKLIKIIERIYYEFSDNGGGSMKDRIAKLVGMVESMIGDANVSRERLNALLDELPYPFYENDETGATIFVNKAWCEHTGLSFDLAIGHGWVKIIHPDDLQRLQMEGADYLSDGKDYEGTFRMVHWITKEVFIVHCTASKIYGYSGKLSGIMGKLRRV